MPRHCARVVVLLSLVLAWSATPLAAQAVFDGTGFASGRDTHTVFPYEHVDPLSGNLLLMTTDLSLPGNAGMPLVVQRVYNSKIHPNFENNQDTTLEEQSWAGVGWRLHFGRVINPSTATPGATLIEMSDGSRHPLYTTTHFGEGWMTREFWRYDRTTHTLKLPNGYVYTFGHVAAPNGMLTDVRYVTRIEDAYGNSLVFTYFAAPGPTDGVQTITQDLGAGQSRTVTFTYNPTTRMLATMVYDGRTWTYNMWPANVTGHYWLTDVQTPTNLTRWHFEYDATLPGGELKSLVAPSGGFVRFVYATQQRTLNQLSVPVRVVTSRATDAPDVTPGTWTFQYGQGTNGDESVVTTPCNIARYRYLGVGTGGPFNAWRSGLLAQRTLSSTGGTVLEQETLTWGTLDPVSPDPIPPVPGGSTGDPAVYPAHLLERVVTRGTPSWRTTFEFHQADGRFNDYGRPYRVRAYDEGNVTYRQTETTYEYGFFQNPQLPYVLPVASVVESLGAESATSSVTYDLWTGFPLTTTVRGFTTTYTRTARGNVATVRDAVRPVTTFEYSWGVVSSITPPAVIPVSPPTITRSIRSDGLVAWERVGPTDAGRTTYKYDDIGRVTRVTPPGGGGAARWSTAYSYDVTHSRFFRTVVGDVQVPSTQRVTLVDLDYFGRAIRTTDPAGVQVEIGYDACGRPTAQSLPYTGGAFLGWGTTATYDALGRVLTTTTLTGPSTSSTTSWSYPGGDVQVTDPLLRTTTYDYQAFGDPGGARLRAVTDADSPEPKVTTYQYALAGDVAEVRGPGTGPTPSGPVRTWRYHATSGLLESDTQPESGTTSYVHDGAGLLTTVTVGIAPNQVVTTLLYDAAGRPRGRDLPGTADDVTLTYDGQGRLASQTLGGVVTAWTYDATFGRLSTRRDELDGRVFTSTYTYNAHDDLTGITYPRPSGSGRQVTYTVAPTTARLTGVTTTVNGGAPSAFATNFTYDASGRLASYQTGPVLHSVEYDLASRPTSIEAGLSGSSGANRLDLTYSYNAASEVTGIGDPRAGASQTFTYDTLSRLRTADAPGGYGSLTWAYDATGNRTQSLRNGLATNYQYDPTTQFLLSTSGGSAETFTPGPLGRVAADSQGIYTYRANGTVGTVSRTTPAMTATYDYAADGWRIKRTVNGTTSYTLRGVGTQTLSTFDVLNGTAVWSRDYIYGAGRLLGAVKRNASALVAFSAAASSVGEGAGPATASVVLTTTDGLPVAWPVTVQYTTANGTAVAGADYTTTSGTVTFPTGSPSGATQPISVLLVNDALDEADETFTITVSAPSGGGLGTVATHTVTITDNDAPPTLTVNCQTVAETVGIATCTVTPSAPSGLVMSVLFGTANGTALAAAGDYTPVSGYVLSWAPGASGAQSVGVSIADDGWTEPAETVLGRVTAATNATIAGTGESPLTITANDGTRVTIDAALPGRYFADLHAGPGVDDYLLMANPTGTATTARVTYVRPDGSGTTRDVSVPAWTRISLHMPADPTIAGAGLVSAAVQSLNAAVPLDVEHAQYSGTSWSVGRSTEGVVPASTWYLAEGNVSTFEEYVTVFNVEPVAVSVVWTAYRPNGTTATRTEILPAGPGRTRLRVRDWTALGLGDHGTRLTATRVDTGAAAGLVVERTQEWESDRREAASSPGASALSTTWHVAEGHKGAFDGYYTVLNPQASAQTIAVTYRHENGVTYAGSLTVGASSRATFSIPSWVPDGSVGLTLTASLGIAVERSMYGGPMWTVGHSGVASPTGGTTWRFAEGATGWFDTYFALTNLSGTTTTATLTFMTTAGPTVTTTVLVPAQARATVYANAVPGLNNATFRTSVTASQPIVVERASYWPGTSGSGLTAGGDELAGASGVELTHSPEVGAVADVEVGLPGLDAGVAALARPYALLDVEPVGVVSLARAAGQVSEDEQTILARVAEARADFLRHAPPGTPTGVAPPLRTGGTAAAGAAGGATTTAIALPWSGGHLTLGRLQ